jgi:hypothetical protein
LDIGTSQFDNEPLPSSNFDTGLNGIVFPFWSDMEMDAAPSGDGVWYWANSTYAAFEWIAHAAYDVNTRFQFSAEYNAATQSVWVYKYYVVADSGTSATIGLQGGRSGPAVQYSFDEALAPAGTMVTCNFSGSNGGSCSSASFLGPP